MRMDRVLHGKNMGHNAMASSQYTQGHLFLPFIHHHSKGDSDKINEQNVVGSAKKRNKAGKGGVACMSKYKAVTAVREGSGGGWLQDGPGSGRGSTEDPEAGRVCIHEEWPGGYWLEWGVRKNGYGVATIGLVSFSLSFPGIDL